ncbi:MAG TPA: hypothetical protein VMW24_09065 [Sedimentisphaerales bacterium]|nr:hypothetical protein [Sedimentisphaerales bacterium]
MLWTIGEPGGPSGPFYSVVRQDGRVIAMQITDRKYAELLQRAGQAMEGDFDTIEWTTRRLKEIFKDSIFSVDEGSEAYIVRSVVEALFAGLSDK